MKHVWTIEDEEICVPVHCVNCGALYLRDSFVTLAPCLSIDELITKAGDESAWRAEGEKL